ncbi:hypothetical protein [Allobranchiibius sp. CTAmp26]|uniref:hypothetical protein n=1 Tax=Allobranchiibius sp. CTAmp26 TaxID=2815214 RepID=UPI001AA1BCBF|nr:hypothetical protein [Allobranchiibius sp. CTAmp26]MBO1756135.1 hypothetical protein [Allobranchiibius sp. CTAmp26]
MRHHVLLSIVTIDAVPDNGYYLGKVAQGQHGESTAFAARWPTRRPSADHSAPPTRGPHRRVNWMRIEGGRIAKIRVTFDPRPILAGAEGDS